MRSVREYQQALIDRGYDLGPSGVDGKAGKMTAAALEAFQRSEGLEPDGKYGPATEAILFPPAQPTLPFGKDIPASWMPKADLDRVIVHWTAGQNRPSSDDVRHYHVLWASDGQPVRGVPTIDKNDASGVRSGYAAHTLNCNTGSIGVSMCGMMGAVESPFSPGPAPLTQVQWDAMIRGVAQLCIRYGIPVTPQTVLTHAEVQGNLGIRQKGKWDVTRLPFDKTVVGARAVGDLLRRQVAAEISKQR